MSLSEDAHDCFAALLFFFNDTATTEIYTLSLHDALPISTISELPPGAKGTTKRMGRVGQASCGTRLTDRKSTRLNSSHQIISYAVFCLKKKIISWIHLSGYSPAIGRRYVGDHGVCFSGDH